MERAILTLTSSESKRLIGKAVARLPAVKKAYKHGIVFIATSTSTAYVAEELLGITIEEKGLFTAGVVVPRGICLTSEKKRHSYIVAKRGAAEKATLSEMQQKWLPQMGHEDVFIKGANAIDSNGAAGILLGNAKGIGTGGTIAAALGAISARGISLIIPAGLEKLVPGSLMDIAPKVNGNYLYSAGLPSGMIIVKGNIITEIEAFHILTETTATTVAAGGIHGAEGCHTFVLEGPKEQIEKSWRLLESIKGEKPVLTETEDCDKCDRSCHYNTDEQMITLRKKFQTLKD